MGSMTHRVLKPHRSKMSTIYMYVIMNIYIYIYIYIYFTIPSLTFFFGSYFHYSVGPVNTISEINSSEIPSV